MDRELFLQLLLKHQTDIKAFIGSVVRDRQARDDVFQDVSLTLWRQFSSFDSARSFGAWARGVAAKKVLHERRQNQRAPVAFEPAAIAAVLDAFERISATSNRRLDALEECLDELPEHARSLLQMRYDQGLSVSQIAERMKRNVDAVYQTLSRLRVKLAECVQSRMEVSQGKQ